MVKAVDASIAKAAVSAPRRLDNFAVGAQASRLHRFEQFHEVELLVFLDKSRVTQLDNDAEKNSGAKEHLTRVEQPVGGLADPEELVRRGLK